MEFYWEDIAKLVGAAIAGAILGIEREYRSKPAGLRTLIMITVGSALFSILSVSIVSDSPDRIASNIVTGVGFVGGGVIFKEGITVKGVTTASTIWIAAAIGMAFGFSRYADAVITLIIVLVTLTLLSKFQNSISGSDVMVFKIGFDSEDYSTQEIEKAFSNMKLKYSQTHLSKKGRDVYITFQIDVPRNKVSELNSFLINNAAIKTFDT